MLLNKTLLEILGTLKEYPGLRFSEDSARVGDIGTITADAILIADTIDVQSKIITSDKGADFDIRNFQKFVEKAGSRIQRINHIGISYSCENISEEISFYRQALKGSPWKIYQENSGSDTQWLFIGDTSDWQKPLFEIVLTQSPAKLINEWTPHFQIDIDTTLNYAELKEITDTTFGKNFNRWELDVKDQGVVLVMGILGSVGETKICLGIGTNLRNTQDHRKYDLKELN